MVSATISGSADCVSHRYFVTLPLTDSSNVRYTYDAPGGKLSNPMTVLAALPAGNDHVAGRLRFGPDQKLYLTLGDQGNNQLGNVCLVIESQRLPSRAEIEPRAKLGLRPLIRDGEPRRRRGACAGCTRGLR